MVVQTRYQAFFIHFLASAGLFALAISALVLVWYPSPYYHIEGLWKGIQIAACVDILIGPSLTLLVFKRGKKSLKFDLICIVALQLAALGYGLFTIHSQRPYFVVFADEGFHSVRWSDITGHGKTDDELRALHAAVPGRPPLIAIRPPASADEKAGMVVEMMMGVDFAEMAGRYVTLTPETWRSVVKNAIKPEKYAPELKASLAALCKEKHCKPEALAVFTLSGRFEEAFIVFERESGHLVGYADAPDKLAAAPRGK